MGRPALLLLTAIALLLLACGNEPAVSPAPVEQRITNLLELHTVEYRYRDVIYYGERETLLGLLTTLDRQILFAVEIVVQAGVDLTEGVEVLRDESNPGFALVRIPQPEVLLVDVDEESIEQFFVRERGGRIEWNVVAAEMEQVKARVEADAVDKGILRRAEENAGLLVEELMTVAGFEEVTVQFRPIEELRG